MLNFHCSICSWSRMLLFCWRVRITVRIRWRWRRPPRPFGTCVKWASTTNWSLESTSLFRVLMSRTRNVNSFSEYSRRTRHRQSECHVACK